VIDHDPHRPARGQHRQNPGVEVLQHRAHREIVRRAVSAEAVVQRHRHRIEHLLIERLRIGGVRTGQVEARHDSTR